MYKNSIFLRIWTRPKLQIGLNLFAIVAPQLILNAFGIYLLGASVFLPILSICYAAVIIAKIISSQKIFKSIQLCQSYVPVKNNKKLNESKQKKLSSFIEKISQQLKIPTPNIYYNQHNKSVSACAIWEDWNKYRVVLSKGFVKAFESNEIDAKTVKCILGHELSHIYYRDSPSDFLIGIISFINYGYAFLGVTIMLALAILLSSTTIAVIPVNLSVATLTFGVICSGISVAAIAPLTYLCAKSISRAKEFRADLKAYELIGDASIASKMSDKLHQVLYQRGHLLQENMFGYKEMSFSLEWLLRIKPELLAQYLCANSEKLKAQVSKERFREFNELKNAFGNYVRSLCTPNSPEVLGNVRKKIDKFLNVLLTAEQLKTLAVVELMERQRLPITPWYDTNTWLACWNSFMATHPSCPAREAVILAAAKNKVSVSSKYSRQRL